MNQLERAFFAKKGEQNMSKYFSVIFWAMLIVAGILMFIATDQMENRFEEIETKVDEMNIMLKEMSK